MDNDSWMVRAAWKVSGWVKEIYAAHLLRWIEREARKRKRREEASQDPSDASVAVVDFRRVRDTSRGGNEEEEEAGSAPGRHREDRGGGEQ